MKNEDRVASLIDLCGLRPWRRALFTTFSLNITFFETFILRKLEDVGCVDILILVDHSFYLESLSERQASGAGREYRIAPVQMLTRGVFHPKLTYLWGADNDACAVGSGNLTYAGQGANLECLDVLLSEREPEAFGQVSDFFGALLASPRLRLLDQQERIGDYQKRAGRKMSAGHDGSAPRLLHSLREPILPQALKQLQRSAAFERIVCMAPFHDPEGAPIGALAKALSASQVDIAIDPNDRSAPFEKSVLSSSARKVQFVSPGKEERRCLHAKWFDSHGPAGSYLMTGSANATRTALTSTDNVEAVVLRQIQGDGPITWIPVKPEEIRNEETGLSASVFDGFLVATATSEGTLSGWVRARSDVNGQWKCWLVARHYEWEAGIAEVGPDGAFSMQAPTTLEEARGTSDAVQLRMRRAGKVVAGWVSFPSELDSPPEVRGARVALDRISRGQAIAGDLLRVVHWVCSLINGSAIRVDPVQPHGGTARTQAMESANLLSYSEWATASELANAGRSDNVAGLFRRTLEMLARGKEALVRLSRQGANALDSDDELDGSPSPAPEEEYNAIAEITDAIQAALKLAPRTPMATEFIRAHAMLTFRPAFTNQDAGLASTKALDWLRWIAQLDLEPDVRESLRGLVWVLAGLSQSRAVDDRAEARAAELRRMLEKLFGSPLASPSLSDAFLDPALSGANTFAPEIEVGMHKIVVARSLRADLRSFMEAVRNGTAPAVTPVLTQSIDKEVLARLRSRNRSVSLKSPTSDGCPRCYCAIPAAERLALESRYAILCRGCGCVLVAYGVNL